jgi:hypothetical protein
MMNLSQSRRRLLLLLPPIALGILGIFHPVGPGHSPFHIVSESPTWWTVLHILQLPLLALVALSVYLVVAGFPGRAAMVSRAGLAVFVVFYTAYDSITGIASGIIVQETRSFSSEEQSVAEPLVNSLFLGGGPYTFITALAMLGWIISTIAAAVAMSRVGVARLPVGLMVLAAIAFGITHEPPFGPIGMAAFAGSIALMEFAPQRFWKSCPVPWNLEPTAMKLETTQSVTSKGSGWSADPTTLS